ncbi:MAG: alpha/beta fold hydrolase [Nitrososphaera sp.]|jgi:polyhydroxyalkanoate synthase
MKTTPSFLQIFPAMFELYVKSIKVNQFYADLFARTFRQAVDIVSQQEKAGMKDNSLYEVWLKLTDAELEKDLRAEPFLTMISDLTKAGVDLRRRMREAGLPVLFLDWLFDTYVRSFMVSASMPKDYDFTAFEIVWVKDKTRLLHYRATPDGRYDKSTSKPPLLVVYAPINKFHIMDISPDRSVVRNLLSHGIDVYLLDWGFPEWSDSEMSLGDYVRHIESAVEAIKKESGHEKISILGYCWGGIISLIYSALNDNKNVKKLILMAQPVDFSKDKTILATWARAVDVDKMMDEFGHMDGAVLDIGFLMRNPPRYTFDKYLKFFQKVGDAKFVSNFFAVENWLHDTPMLPGKMYRQIINDCYKNNLLISGNMQVDVVYDNEEGGGIGKITVDLKKISVPILTIVAEQDDLVSPESTLAINDYVSSMNKTVLKLPGGHVGLCISSHAHSKLWPEVAKWISQ